MRWGRLLQAVGVGLTLLGLVFTGGVPLENAALSQVSWDVRLWACLVLACATYAVLSILLVLVWAAILNTFVPGCLGAREAYALYAITQIMKYVPSNVVHFVGRHVALRRGGVAHLALVSTVVAEAAILVCGACLTIAALEADVLTAVYRRHVATSGSAIMMTVGLACCAAAGLLWLHCAGVRRAGVRSVTRRVAARLMAALTGATLFFAATSLLISTVSRLLLDDPAGFEISAVAAMLAGA